MVPVVFPVYLQLQTCQLKPFISIVAASPVAAMTEMRIPNYDLSKYFPGGWYGRLSAFLVCKTLGCNGILIGSYVLNQKLRRMKTKTFVIGMVLTTMVSGQLLAQVDTMGKRKTDTAWKNQRDTTGRSDTAWKDKRDTNQVSLNRYHRQYNDESTRLTGSQSTIGWTLSKMLTQDMITVNNRWFVRKYRNEEWKQGMI